MIRKFLRRKRSTAHRDTPFLLQKILKFSFFILPFGKNLYLLLRLRVTTVTAAPAASIAAAPHRISGAASPVFAALLDEVVPAFDPDVEPAVLFPVLLPVFVPLLPSFLLPLFLLSSLLLSSFLSSSPLTFVTLTSTVTSRPSGFSNSSPSQLPHRRLQSLPRKCSSTIPNFPDQPSEMKSGKKKLRLKEVQRW